MNRLLENSLVQTVDIAPCHGSGKLVRHEPREIGARLITALARGGAIFLKNLGWNLNCRIIFYRFPHIHILDGKFVYVNIQKIGRTGLLQILTLLLRGLQQSDFLSKYRQQNFQIFRRQH